MFMSLKGLLGLILIGGFFGVVTVKTLTNRDKSFLQHCIATAMIIPNIIFSGSGKGK